MFGSWSIFPGMGCGGGGRHLVTIPLQFWGDYCALWGVSMGAGMDELLFGQAPI